MAKNIELWPIDKLIPYQKNSRTHSESQVEQISASIIEFGFTNPILVDSQNGIIAGHGRLMAAKKLNLNEVPVVVLDYLSESQKRAYIIADNKLAELAGWDKEALKEELAFLKESDFNLEAIGFSEAEIAGIENDLLGDDFFESKKVNTSKAEQYLDEKKREGLTEEDDIPESSEKIIVELGEIYQLGEHRLMCGDSTDKETVEKLMNGKKADMVFTDPPYGISVVSKDGSLGGGTKGKYKQVIGDETTDAAVKSFILCKEMKTNLVFWGANHYSNHLPSSPCWLIWDKQDGKRVTFADCELAYTNIDKPARLFKHIWDGFRRDSERGEMRVHPTQKPVQLIVDIFSLFDEESGDKILDLFGGSGSTLIACEKTNRKCFMMELDPHYVQVILERWQNYSGKKAIRTSDGKSWDEIKVL